MFGRCALRLRQCIQFARKRGVLSRCSAAGSGSLVARHRQVHAPCEAEIGNGHKRRRAKQADRHGVLGYKGARRKRLAHRSASRSRSECEPPKSRFPEIVGNIKNAEQTMEGLEGANALAKQVLSQLSYTPTVGVTSILKHFRPRLLRSEVELQTKLNVARVAGAPEASEIAGTDRQGRVAKTA